MYIMNAIKPTYVLYALIYHIIVFKTYTIGINAYLIFFFDDDLLC